MQLTFLIDDDPLQQRIVLSELRVLTALYCGWHSPAKQALDRAIDDPTRIEHALEVVAGIAAVVGFVEASGEALDEAVPSRPVAHLQAIEEHE